MTDPDSFVRQSMRGSLLDVIFEIGILVVCGLFCRDCGRRAEKVGLVYWLVVC